MNVLTLDHVEKRFGGFTALDDLSFAVPEGGIFGFLGGNGAGKTTSLRMALDIIRPTRGRITVLGRAPGRENDALIGFLPEERGLYRRMGVLDTVIYFGRLKGMSASAARKASKALIDKLGLGAWANQTVDKLSKGMSQKVQLATALVNAPRLLILDEPFSGLDPVNQGVLEDLIRESARRGATVVFSTRQEGLRGHARSRRSGLAAPGFCHQPRRSLGPAGRGLGARRGRRQEWLARLGGRHAGWPRPGRSPAGLHRWRLPPKALPDTGAQPARHLSASG
jgi:ABC-type Na+ transport system ATPase subunit NatA